MRRRLLVTNAALLVVLVLLVGWWGATTFMGRSGDDVLDADVADDVVAAARAETVAFLNVDHRKMDELTQKVLDGATGDFKEQYQASIDTVTQAATTQQAVTTGRVETVGLSDVDADSATVFVAARTEGRNKQTGDDVERRAWRIKLTMQNEDGRWLTSGLEFVG